MQILARPPVVMHSGKSKKSLSFSKKTTVRNQSMPVCALGAGAGRASGRPGAGGAFLGTNAKSNSAPESVDSETGEITLAAGAYDPVLVRFERFALQSAVRRILPNSRTAKCLRIRQGGKDVEVWKSKEFDTTSFAGLQTCASVWCCPVCSAKISERRRIELQSAIALHTASGGQVLLLTLTNPHYLGDHLAEVLTRQAKALKAFTGSRASRKLFAEMGLIGSVRAMEVTHGRKRAVNNGWHPHYHVLMFCSSGNDLTACADAMFVQWASSCVKAGLKPPSRFYGLRLDDGSKAAAYASKWGLESEMTKGHTKKATDGETPFDLLRAYLHSGDKQGAALFAEFAECFHGKRQLFWSKGLKAKFGIGESTDEELAYKKDDHASLLGKLTVEQWRAVLRVEGRAVVLQLASKGWEALSRYLDSITEKSGVLNDA